jgi:hypothetical protein
MQTLSRRVALGSVCLLAIAVMAASTQAQAYPSNTIRTMSIRYIILCVKTDGTLGTNAFRPNTLFATDLGPPAS